MKEALLLESMTSEILDLWGFPLCSEHCKFNVDSKNGKEMSQKIDGFSDNLTAIGNCKFCLVLGEYS